MGFNPSPIYESIPVNSDSIKVEQKEQLDDRKETLKRENKKSVHFVENPIEKKGKELYLIGDDRVASPPPFRRGW